MIYQELEIQHVKEIWENMNIEAEPFDAPNGKTDVKRLGINNMLRSSLQEGA